MSDPFTAISDLFDSLRETHRRWTLFRALLTVRALSVLEKQPILTPQLLTAQRITEASALFAETFSAPLLALSNRSMSALPASSQRLILTEAPTIPIGFFGALYERLLIGQKVHREGIFYTPRWLVTQMLDDAMPRHLDRTYRLLDPACGGGAFLLPALERLRAALPDTSLAELVRGSLFGIDRDRGAVELTRVLLGITLLEHGVSRKEMPDLAANIIHRDALLSDSEDAPQSSNPLPLFAYVDREHTAKPSPLGSFDLVIGNPPYGLARDEKITKEEAALLTKRYREVSVGKINKYILFMGRGFELLKAQGTLSYVVPNAWLGIKAGEKIRKKLLTEGYLKAITILPKTTFNLPSVEVVTFLAIKGAPQEAIEIIHRESDAAVARRFTLPARSPLDHRSFIISTVPGRSSMGELDRINGRSFLLGGPLSPFRSTIALQAYARGQGIPPQSEDDVRDHIYDRTAPEDDTTYPYLAGRDVRRYGITWSGSYLKYGPWLAQPTSFDRYTGPRVMVREILAKPPHRVQACYTAETFLYNKSILHIHARPLPGLARYEPEELLLGLVAVLNSTLGSLLLLLNGRKSQRMLFPKIVNDDLKNFPLAQSFYEALPQLSGLARKLSGQLHPLEAIEAELDALVLQLYGLNTLPIIEETTELSKNVA